MVTGVKYLELPEHHFCLEAGCINMTSRYSFMSDGAYPRRTDNFFMCLEITFGECLITLHVEKFTMYGIKWSPYSFGMNSQALFLRSYMKDKIYIHSPYSLEGLKSAIRSEINAFDSKILQRVMTEFRNRI